jgi:hypothetical protein
LNFFLQPFIETVFAVLNALNHKGLEYFPIVWRFSCIYLLLYHSDYCQMIVSSKSTSVLLMEGLTL